MKPHRIRMTNDLVINYGLYQHLQVFVIKTFEKDTKILILWFLLLYFSVHLGPVPRTCQDSTPMIMLTF